eukprot:1346581-Amphidinium_carterae.2
MLNGSNLFPTASDTQEVATSTSKCEMGASQCDSSPSRAIHTFLRALAAACQTTWGKRFSLSVFLGFPIASASQQLKIILSFPSQAQQLAALCTKLASKSVYRPDLDATAPRHWTQHEGLRHIRRNGQTRHTQN